MSSGKAKKAEPEPTRDDLAEKVDATIRNAGADEWGLKGNPEVPHTMVQLLHKYTRYYTLPKEVDEDGEHPLFPQSHDTVTRTRQAVSGPRNEEVKSKGPTSVDFDTQLRTHIGSISGRGDTPVPPELAKLYEELCGETEQEGDEQAAEAAAAEGAAEAPEGDASEAVGESPKESVVTWSALTKLLLDRGIISEIINNFNIVRVLSHIDHDKIEPLIDTFKAKGNSLNLASFIVMMKSQFHYVFELVRIFDLKMEERQLVAQLVDLFEMIDINGQSSMSVEEFTGFLVDQGMLKDAPPEFDMIKLVRSEAVVDEGHQSHIERAFYLKHYDKIAYIEGAGLKTGLRSLKLCNPDLTPFLTLESFSQTPLCVAFIDKEAYLVVACADLTVSFFDANNSLKLVRRISVKSAQLVMCWSTAAGVLYSADHEGKIVGWDVAKVKKGTDKDKAHEAGPGEDWGFYLIKRDDDKPLVMRHDARHAPPHAQKEDPKEDRQGELATSKGSRSRGGKGQRERSGKEDGGKNDESLGDHSQSQAAKRKHRGQKDRPFNNVVMTLLELEVLGLMASCGFDGNVMLWDVYTGKCKTLLDSHELGVRCMAFASSSKVLVTGGYDYHLMVWNPYVGRAIHTLKGHSSEICGIEVIGVLSNQLVSADTEGCVKVWDLRTYLPVDSFFVGEVTTMRAFLSIPSHKRIFCVDRKFIAYDYLNTGASDQTDELPIIKAFYIPRLKVFISGCTTHLRIWDAMTGEVKCKIEHPNSEITDFCVDDRGRKVFIADHKGDITVYNSITGCQIKTLERHGEEVSGLMYCKGDKNIISVSWDQTIKIHDESDKAWHVWRSATSVHEGDITCLDYSRHLGLIATGATDCVITLRCYERLRHVCSLLGHKTDITALAFVDPLPLLVSADFRGNVAVWAVPTLSGPQHPEKEKVLIRFMNMQSLESSASVSCLDPHYDRDSGQFLLYSGDEDGDARIWDLTRLLQEANIKPVPAKVEWDPRKQNNEDGRTDSQIAAKKAMSVEQLELPVTIEQQVVDRLHSWKAHSEGVRSIVVYNQPACIVTAGYDHMVVLWSHHSGSEAPKKMTVLRAYGQIPWSFPVCADMIGIDDETLDAIVEKVRSLEAEGDKIPATARSHKHQEAIAKSRNSRQR